MKHVVQYTESERGWGGEVWFTEFETETKALSAVDECNKNLPALTPDYYIVAKYLGTMSSVPSGYKI